jgi:hypothetical protein
VTNAARQLDVYDNGNGSVNLAWQEFPAQVPDSYNVYLNGVLNQNVAALKATVSGLKGASYNGATVTPPTTYTFKVAAVKTGVEIAASLDSKITIQPSSVMLKTSMRRPFPFPNTGPG